jgi:hypothetical protein
LLYRLKRRWRDGTTHMVFEAEELLEKLVSLVPPPRAHQVRYHGVLAPPGRPRRLPWAELMRRVFAVDVLKCPTCAGPMRILAAVHDPGSVRAMLESMGIPSRAPPNRRARPEPEDDFVA